MEPKTHKIAKPMLGKKSKARGNTIFRSKTYYKALVTKAAQFCLRENTHIKKPVEYKSALENKNMLYDSQQRC